MKTAPGIYPSSSNLQPIPVNTHPNVTGNVNSTTTRATVYDRSNVPLVENSVQSPTKQTTTENSSGVWGFIVTILLILILIGILIRKIFKSEA